MMQQQVNLLAITADDLGFDCLDCFTGRRTGVSPHLDRLAADGLRFSDAYVTSAVCMPSRGSLLSGLYPHQGQGNAGFSKLKDDVVTISQVLHQAGYYCAALDKTGHMHVRTEHHWDFTVDAASTANGRNPHRYNRYVEDCIYAAKAEGKPFLIIANSRDPHRPFAGSRQERQYLTAPRFSWEEAYRRNATCTVHPSKVFAEADVEIPGFLPDVPDIREEYAQYMASIRRLDDTVGAILSALEATGVLDQTIIFFLSDHGHPFPFAKFNCYPFSVRTPLIVRSPFHSNISGRWSDAMLSGIDVAPTLAALAGTSFPRPIAGRSFYHILEGKPDPGRDAVFTEFDGNMLQEEWPMRSIITREHVYILNAWSDGRTRFQDETVKGLALNAMIRAAANHPGIDARVQHFWFRQPEELYERRFDPFCLHNRAADPALQQTQLELHQRLLQWMQETGDPMLPRFVS
jgi:N-sulfoglucosamine sulfohydrolase